MEPNDLNSLPPDEAQLDAWLRASTTQPPLPDDGFSQRVLSALPPPARPDSVRRLWFCVAGALIGGGVAALGAFGSDNQPAGLAALQDMILATLAQLSVPGFGLAVGITVGSLWFAFRDRWRLLPRW